MSHQTPKTLNAYMLGQHLWNSEWDNSYRRLCISLEGMFTEKDVSCLQCNINICLYCNVIM